MTWQIAAGVVGLLVAAFAVVWYKLRAQSNDTALAQNAAAQAEAAHQLAESQLKAKNEADRKALEDEANRVLATPDAKDRERAALDLLARIRGVR